MKKIHVTLLVAMFTTLILQAQVMEDTRVMHLGSQPALTVVLPGTDTKFTDSAWRDYMKSYGRITGVKRAKESVASGVQILDIGGVNRLNVYSQSEAVGDGTKMIVWFDMGGGFLSSSTFPKEYSAAVRFLQDFAHKVKVDLIAIDLENQQKQLSKMESTLTKLQRENDSLHKIIEDSKKRIAQAETDIQKNLQDQDMAQKEIDNQQTTVGSIRKKLEDTKAQKQN
jgi:molecular chaperone DnaK (HSP70)